MVAGTQSCRQADSEGWAGVKGVGTERGGHAIGATKDSFEGADRTDGASGSVGTRPAPVSRVRVFY